MNQAGRSYDGYSDNYHLSHVCESPIEIRRKKKVTLIWAAIVIATVLTISAATISLSIGLKIKNQGGLNSSTSAPNEETTTQGPVKPTEPPKPLSGQVKQILGEFSLNINASVDPCDDFYEYACGSFSKRYPIVNNKSQVNYYSLFADKVYKKVTQRLDSNKLSSHPLRPVVYIKNVWDSCVGDTSKTTDQMVKLMEYLTEIDKLDSWLSKFTKVTRDGHNVLFTLKTSAHVRSFFEVSIDGPQLEFADAYSTDELSPLLDYYADLINLYKPESEREEQVKLAREIIEFEHWMSTNTTSAAERARWPPMNITQVEQLDQITKMDWNKTLADIFNVVEYDLEYEEVVIMDVKYIENFRKLVDSKDEAFLGEYFKLALVRESCFFLGQECRDMHFKMASSIKKFESKKDYEQRKCFNTLDKYLQGLLFKVYDPNHHTFDDYIVENFTRNIADSLENLVNNITWMDSETKKMVYIRNKSNRAKVRAPYEIKSETNFMKRYLQVPFVNSTEKVDIFDYFKSIIQVNRERQSEILLDLDEWPISLFEAHPVWMEAIGELFVPSYFVNGPFYTNDLPEFIRFGFFGSILAHEMTHKFDAVAANFTKRETSRTTVVWSNWTREQFDYKMQCLIGAYDGQEVASAKINGSSTLNENLADIVGLKVAFASFKNNMWTGPFNSNDFPNPLKDMTDDQLFFLSYANTHCSNDGQELPVELELGLASPRKFRVNLPLAHSEKFAHAFSCQAGSKMNPIKKCTIE